MTRLLSCLTLTLLVAACVPPKAELVEETTSPKPKTEATQPAAPEENPAQVPLVVQGESGMRVPDLTDRLPDKRDMSPTVTPRNPGGPVIASPPTANQ